MKLYVMRHGQTNWNVLRKIQGKTDIKLNENGIKQAINQKQVFNKLNIDLIISSPLKRAFQTATIVSEDKKVDIIIDEALIERGYGEYEGVLVQNLDGLELYNYKLNKSEKGIEPVVDLFNRVWKFLDDIKVKYYDKNILLVTHGGTTRAIDAYFNQLNGDEVLSTHIKNCEIREYMFN